MSRKKSSLGANFVYNFISQVLTLIVPLVTTPYVARILQEEGNGQVSFALSIVTYFILFANLGFTVYGQREIAKCDEDKEKRRKTFWGIVVARSITTTLSLGVLACLLFTVGFGEKYNILIFMLAVQVIAVYFDVAFYYQGIENFREIAIQTIILRVLSLIAIFCFVKKAEDTWVYALSISVSVLLSNLMLWVGIFRDVGLPCGGIAIKEHFSKTILIFLPTLAVTIYSVCDKTMIGLLSSNPDYDNGCYEQAYKLNGVALLLVTVISQVFMSRNANEYGKGNMGGLNNNIYFASNYVWCIGSALVAGFAVLAPNLSSWFLGEGYVEVPLLLQIMSVRFICSGLGVVLGDQYFIVIGKEHYTLLATICAALLNVGLNALLISPMGAIGAAIATAVAEFTVVAIYFILLLAKKRLSVKKIILTGWRYVLSAAVMMFAIYFIQRPFGYSILSFSLITAAGAIIYGVCLLLLRDQFILSIMKKIKDKVFKRKKSEGE